MPYLWLRRLHLTLLMIAGLPILLLSLTGTYLVYGHDIQEALEPSLWRVEPAGRTPLGYEALLAKVGEQRPDLKLWALDKGYTPDRAWRIWLGGGAGAVNVDPFTGDILGQYRPNRNLNGIIEGLHRRWLVNDRQWAPWVRHFVSACSLVLMIQVLVGLALWLIPGRRLSRLKIDFSHRPRTIVFRLHQLAGVISLPLLLMVAFTGLAMYWTAPARTVVEALSPGVIEDRAEPDPGASPLRALDSAVALGQAAFPDLPVRGIRLPNESGRPVMMHLYAHEGAPPVRVWVGDDPPRVLDVHDTRTASAATWIWHMRDPLHMGTFAGPLVKALWVLVALMPAAFVGTGLWLYGNRRNWSWASPGAARASAAKPS
ncbi:MAG: PepSY domain-containing protein [Alphaproteobacteria bacterium]|nr:PepSY domain-containing protein [Alphaproteobacteria bacterium]MBU0795872.1 PepSY domain-containing protein [Alphaproteobacteria bacterium]MBU0888592.1 PepSY domain-containing protein [Alphaproteobacteria bacterium]MBU1813674.1 PepSY domain-containing protein [Alphaproteobacteria bacterium]MBU2089023.1 PepSY domain-containing protein [Alphaproteobacteria bacterium]